MQKPYLSSFHNDPKLNRVPQEKKIQPLFKKNFAVQEELPERSIEVTEAQHKVNLSETLQVRPNSSNIKMKFRNHSNHRSENFNESKESLEFLINKLKSEKLEVYKDLLTYEEKYQHKLCIRARLEEMKDICSYLLEMSAITSERLNVENDLYGFLQAGTMSLAYDEYVREASSDEEENLDSEEFLQHLIEISGVACICQSKLTETNSVSLAVYPYFYHQAVGADLMLKSRTDSLDFDLTKYIFPFLSFSLEDSLRLSNSERTIGNYKLICKLSNIKEPQEILIKMVETGVSIELRDSLLIVNDFYLQELINLNKLLEANAYLSKNLGLITVDEEEKLIWQGKAWDIHKYSRVENHDGSLLTNIEESTEKFEGYYQFLYSSFILIYNLKVDFWKN